jgi:hypothetical protein
MSSPPAPANYEQRNEASWRDFVTRYLAKTFTKGGEVNIAGGKLILTDTVTGQRYSVTVASGVVALVGPL